ncbi:MAG TPA: thioredoxin [Candidatus Gemmiger stercoripullorum]|nr:thioredoxin [Candidatus Gemmiger stercoripullorum]
MAVFDITKENFEQKVLASPVPVLVDFWAPWCGYCLRLGPAVAQVAAEEDGRLAVGKLNIDDAPELAARYGISSIPTLILFKNGQACPPVVGPSGKGGIRAYLSEQGL